MIFNMKFKFLLLLVFFIPLMATAQSDDVQLIQPIVESPQMDKSQARTFAKEQQFKNWGISKLLLDQPMEKYTGKHVKICICDTGMPEHPDVIDHITNAANFSDDNNVTDGNGHATHVAGIITEIAPEAEIITAKVLSNSGSGKSSDVAKGIDWCVESGSTIINLSLGSNSTNAAIRNAVSRAYAKGVLIFAAVGNDGQSDSINLIGYPARYPETIGVGSINDELKTSRFSSSGDEGILMAPGEKILSTYKDGKYVVLSGTSMATPYVAGVTALFIQKNQIIANIDTVYKKTSNDMAPNGFDIYSFYGHISPVELFNIKPDDPVDEPDDPKDPIDEPGDDDKVPIESQFNWRWWVPIGLVVVFIASFFLIKNRQKNQI